MKLQSSTHELFTEFLRRDPVDPVEEVLPEGWVRAPAGAHLHWSLEQLLESFAMETVMARREIAVLLGPWAALVAASTNDERVAASRAYARRVGLRGAIGTEHHWPRHRKALERAIAAEPRRLLDDEPERAARVRILTGAALVLGQDIAYSRPPRRRRERDPARADRAERRATAWARRIVIMARAARLVDRAIPGARRSTLNGTERETERDVRIRLVAEAALGAITDAGRPVPKGRVTFDTDDGRKTFNLAAPAGLSFYNRGPEWAMRSPLEDLPPEYLAKWLNQRVRWRLLDELVPSWRARETVRDLNSMGFDEPLYDAVGEPTGLTLADTVVSVAPNSASTDVLVPPLEVSPATLIMSGVADRLVTPDDLNYMQEKEGHSHAEVAEKLGITEEASRQRRHRAEKRLLRAWKALTPDEQRRLIVEAWQDANREREAREAFREREAREAFRAAREAYTACLPGVRTPSLSRGAGSTRRPA